MHAQLVCASGKGPAINNAGVFMIAEFAEEGLCGFSGF